MQIYPLGLLAFISELPESPHWFLSHGKKDDAQKSLTAILGAGEEAESKLEELVKASEEEGDENVGYWSVYSFILLSVEIIGWLF